MHPSTLDLSEFEASCRFTMTRRGGPGGQNRNKVETAVIVEHLATGILAEANERRSQAENRQVAIQRLRIAIALQKRTEKPSVDWQVGFVASHKWQAYVVKGRINISESNVDFPALIAEALDLLEWTGEDLKQTASSLLVSASQLVKLLKLEPSALLAFNGRRQAIGLHPIR